MDLEYWKPLGMTFIPHSLAAQFSMQLPNWFDPSGSWNFHEAKTPTKDLRWLWNLCQWLQEVEGTKKKKSSKNGFPSQIYGSLKSP